MQKTNGPELPQTTPPPLTSEQRTSTGHEPRTLAIISFLSSLCYASRWQLRSISPSGLPVPYGSSRRSADRSLKFAPLRHPRRTPRNLCSALASGSHAFAIPDVLL